MMDIDTTYGIDPWSDDDYDWPPELVDDRADRQDHNDNAMEDWRISNR